MLLYLIESAVPLLTFLLVWTLILALKKNIGKHKKIAIIYAVSTCVSIILVAVLVRVGFVIGENAPKWIMDIHLVFIYGILPLLLGLVVTAFKGKRFLHIGLAVTYLVFWCGSLVTGAMIFMMHHNWI